MQSFLDLPPRCGKPRPYGLTHMIDSGLTARDAEGQVQAAGDYIDIVKLGWGTGYVAADLERKLEVYREAGIPVVLGGTLGEVALARGRLEQYLNWIERLGLSYVEVSDGAIEIGRREKLELIERLAAQEGVVVLSEVGSKDPEATVAPFRWVQEIREELEAGARFVILEARESGNAGVYRPNGEVRMGLIEEVEHNIDTQVLIFEAPKRHQQVWMIQRLGPDVNLGNIQPTDVIGLETLRLGLRADTIGFSVPDLDPKPPPAREVTRLGASG